MASPLEQYEWEARQKIIREAQAEQARQLEIIRKNNPRRYEDMTGKPAQIPILPRDTGNPWVDDWGVGVSRKKLQDIIDNRGFDNWRNQIGKDARRDFEEFQGVQQRQKGPSNNDLPGITGTNSTNKFKPQYGPVEWRKPGESFTTGTGMGGTPKTYQDVPYKPANPGYTWGTGNGGTQPNQPNQSDLRKAGDRERNTARDYGPQTPERFGDWESRLDIAGRRDRDAASRKDIPATRDLGWRDPRRLNYEPGSLSGRAKPVDLSTYGFEGGKIGPNQSLIELERQERQRELTRVNNKQRAEMEAFQKLQAAKGKNVGSDWVSNPIQRNEQKVRDEIDRLKEKNRPQQEMEARRRINAERDRFKSADYDAFSDRARRLREAERMPGKPQEITGTKPIGFPRTSAEGNIVPFKSKTSGDRQTGSNPLRGYEDGSGSGGSGRWNKPKPDKPDGGGGGIDWEQIRKKADPKTILGMMGDKGGGTQNRGPVGTIERPNNRNVLAPKYSGSPTLTTPFSGNGSKNFVRGVGGASGAADLIGQGLAWKQAIDRQRDIEALRRQLKKELGLNDKQLDDIQKRYKPRYKDREFIQNDSELDMFAPGGLRDAARAAKRGISPERYKRERFGPQTRDDFDRTRRGLPFKPIIDPEQYGPKIPDWDKVNEARRKKRIKDEDDKYFTSDDFKKRRKQNDEWDKEPWKRPPSEQRKFPPFDPRYPFNPFPPGQPGGPIPSRPPIIGWEVDLRSTSQLGNESPVTIYLRYTLMGNNGGPMEVAPYLSQFFMVHTHGFLLSYTSSQSPDTFGIGLPQFTSGGALKEPKQEEEYKEKWGEQWDWTERDSRWGNEPLPVFNDFLEDKADSRRYGKFQVSTPLIRVVIVGSKPIFAGEPARRPKIDPNTKPPATDDPEDKMPCKYLEDIETSTQLDYFNQSTKRMDRKSFSIHRGTDEAFQFLSREVASLKESISRLSDVLEVDKYKSAAGKIVAPVAVAQVYQAGLAVTPLAAIPAVRTLQGEMGIFAAMNHMLSGHHLLGKVQLPSNPMDTTAAKFSPLTVVGMMLGMHNNTGAMIGVPSKMSTISTNAAGTVESKVTPFRNATDAIENINGSVQGMSVDMSAVIEMLFKVLQNQEMLNNMVHKETYKTDLLIKDTGCRTTEITVPRPGVMKHGKLTEGALNTFKWDSVFGVGKSFTTVPVWKGEMDKHQLGLKTNMQAQIAASSVFFPIALKDKTAMPSLKTRGQKASDDWKKYVKTINNATEGGLYHGPGMPESRIQEIVNGVARNIETGSETFLGGERLA